MKNLITILTISCLGLLISDVVAQDELEKYESSVGAFSIELPGKPISQQQDVGGGTIQHQHITGGEDGAIIIWFQDTTRISADEIIPIASDAIVKQAGGDVISKKDIEFNGHPGKYIVANVMNPKGIVRSAVYFVSGRVYCITVVGSEDFANSETSDRVFESFEVTQVNLAARIHNADKRSELKLVKQD